MTETTLVMLSYKRFPKLKFALGDIKEKAGIPLNLVLRVQGAEELSQVQKKQINSLAEKYENHEVIYTKGNEYIAKPRFDTINRARELFGTPYLLSIDDDMRIPKNSPREMLKILKQRKGLAGVSCWCEPYYAQWIMSNGNLKNKRCQPNTSPVPTHIMGSGAVVLRSEVFDTAHFDPKMTIGYVDFDFCLSAKKAGWNFAIMARPEMKAINQNKDPEDENYRIERRNYEIIGKNYKRFKRKWGYTIREGEEILRRLENKNG